MSNPTKQELTELVLLASHYLDLAIRHLEKRQDPRAEAFRTTLEQIKNKNK